MGQAAVGVGFFGLAPGLVEFNEVVDCPAGEFVLFAARGLRPGVSGQRLFFCLLVAREFDGERAEVTSTSTDPPVLRPEGLLKDVDCLPRLVIVIAGRVK